jgi:hypothetical protein
VVDDADVPVVDEGQDAGSGVAAADADVVQAAVVADGDDAGVVDAVAADAVVGGGAEPGGAGFGAGGPGGGGGGAGQGAVWPLVVVVAGEPVELGLQAGDGGGGGLAGEPFLQGLVVALDLAAGLGVVGAGVPEADVQGGEFGLERDFAAAAGFAGEDCAVAGSMLAGSPCWLAAWRKTVTTPAALKVRRAAEAVSSREWSSMTLRISASVPSASCQWVMSSCQRSLGWSAWKRTQELRGRLRGCGVTNPRLVKIRQIVETAGEVPCRPARWAAIVAAPASRPWLVRLLRSPTISSSIRGPIWRGHECGRRGPGFQARLALGLVAGGQRLHPAAGHPQFAGYLALAASFHHHSGDNKPGQRHRTPPRRLV